VRPLGAGGLALANSLAITAEVLALIWVLRRRWRGVDARATLRAAWRILLATLAMSLALGIVLRLAEQAGLGPLPAIAMGIGVSGITFVVAGLIAQVPLLREASQIGRRALAPQPPPDRLG
jgi:putative peptidoglycan lipid II flippase